MISIHMQNLDVFASRDIERVVYLQYGVLQTIQMGKLTM